MIKIILSIAFALFLFAVNKCYSAVDCDNVNDVITNSTYSTTALDEFTIMYWTYANSIENGVEVRMTESARFSTASPWGTGLCLSSVVNLNNLSYDCETDVDGKWAHIAIRWNEADDDAEMFVNGEQVAQDLSVTSDTFDFTGFSLCSGDGFPSDSSLYDFKFYERYLQDSEIKQGMRCTNYPTGDMAGHLRLQDSTNLTDISGNGNDGTYTNCPASISDAPPTSWCG